MGKISAEKEALKEQEREISEMRTQLDRMRRDKEEAQSKYAILQEKLRQVSIDKICTKICTKFVLNLYKIRTNFGLIRSN